MTGGTQNWFWVLQNFEPKSYENGSRHSHGLIPWPLARFFSFLTGRWEYSRVYLYLLFSAMVHSLTDTLYWANKVGTNITKLLPSFIVSSGWLFSSICPGSQPGPLHDTSATRGRLFSITWRLRRVKFKIGTAITLFASPLNVGKQYDCWIEVLGYKFTRFFSRVAWIILFCLDLSR